MQATLPCNLSLIDCFFSLGRVAVEVIHAVVCRGRRCPNGSSAHHVRWLLGRSVIPPVLARRPRDRHQSPPLSRDPSARRPVSFLLLHRSAVIPNVTATREGGVEMTTGKRFPVGVEIPEWKSHENPVGMGIGVQYGNGVKEWE